MVRKLVGGNTNPLQADGTIMYCNSCGDYMLSLFDAEIMGDGAGTETSCLNCGAEFSHVGGAYVEN